MAPFAAGESQVSAIIVVGAGHAGGQAAASLRQEGCEDEILIIGDEPHIPYQRPPLSKQYLAGEQGLERVYLRPEKFYADRNISIRSGVTVTAIDRAARNVTTSDGDVLAYTKLLLATGSRPRRLPVAGGDLPGIHYLRTIADVDAIKAEMAPGRKVVVVGGGYIGLEVAAVCIEAGMEVRVVEMESRLLQRVATASMAEFYHNLHSGRGVHLHTGVTVSGFTGNGRVSGVRCGETDFDADLVIVGIGIVPNVELAAAAGLGCDNGIVVDERCRTSDPNIYAAGDCTNHPNPLLERRLRLESVPNAMEQARVAAANICGGDKVYASVPWFWSDQYDLKLQMVGFAADGDTEVLRGDKAANSFAVLHLRDAVVKAVDAVNSPREFMVCKQLIGRKVDAGVLANPETDLKTLL